MKIHFQILGAIAVAVGSYAAPSIFVLSNAQAADRCLFEGNRGTGLRPLADGSELRRRGLQTIKIVPLQNRHDLQDLAPEVRTAVQDVIQWKRVSEKEFLATDALVEFYAGGRDLGSASGAYIIVTYAPRGQIYGRIYRMENRKYSPVADVARASVAQCQVGIRDAMVSKR